MASTRLGPIIMVVRDVAATKEFYTGLGLRAAAQLEESMVAFGAAAFHSRFQPALSKHCACLCSDTGTQVPLLLRQGNVDSASDCIGGSTPLLSLQVADLDACMVHAMSNGAVMDGAIEFAPTGRTAVLRAPDGHMLALTESDDAER